MENKTATMKTSSSLCSYVSCSRQLFLASLDMTKTHRVGQQSVTAVHKNLKSCTMHTQSY